MTPTCECGCGRPVRLSEKARHSRGYAKGQPLRFAQGHTGRTGKRQPGKYLYKGNQTLHVVIAAKALGRPLPAGAEVHHVDGNKQNNANSNLVICPSRAYHMLLHVRQRVIAAGGNPNTQRICTACKELVFLVDLVQTDSATRCRNCNTRLILKLRTYRASSREVHP